MVLVALLLMGAKCQKPDGPGGFLWKESDHGGLVVLFPARYKRPFRSVGVFRRNRLVEQLFYTGKANGDRQHWRSNMSITEFPDRRLKVRAFRRRRSICYRIRDPHVRND